MKRFVTALLAAAVAGALFVASPLVAMPKGTDHFNKSTERDSGEDCGPGNSLAISAPTKLWPPNHKYFEDDLYVVARDTESTSGNRDITLTTYGTHDQYDGDTGLEENGSGNTADDIVVNESLPAAPDSTDQRPGAVESGSEEVITDWKARAERSGRFKEGRTYTLTGLAQFSDGTCEWSYSFSVPHDMRPENREDPTAPDA